MRLSGYLKFHNPCGLDQFLAADNRLVVYTLRCSFNLVAIYFALPAHVDSTGRSWDLVVR